MFRNSHIVEFVLSSHIDRPQNGTELIKRKYAVPFCADPQNRGSWGKFKKKLRLQQKVKYNPPMPVRYDKQFGELAYYIPDDTSLAVTVQVERKTK
jgi:hypothetical protein